MLNKPVPNDSSQSQILSMYDSHSSGEITPSSTVHPLVCNSCAARRIASGGGALLRCTDTMARVSKFFLPAPESS